MDAASPPPSPPAVPAPRRAHGAVLARAVAWAGTALFAALSWAQPTGSEATGSRAPAPAVPALAVPEPSQWPGPAGLTLRGWVFQPPGRPRATVVALHGCGGPVAANGRLRNHLREWAALLVADGLAVVVPDSLGPRGETELCTQRMRDRRVTQADRRADALATLDWVARQPWADARRLALLGWSHGGSAVLEASDLSLPAVAAASVQPALAMAFYPGCQDALRRGYRPAAPLVLFLGADDDWTAPGPCEALGRQVGAEVRVYPGAFHAFDAPGEGVRLRRDVPGGVRPGSGVHAGPEPAAREDARRRVLERLGALGR